MRKLVMLLFASILLVACGNDEPKEVDDEGENVKAHIDIRDEIIGDSYQVMRIIEKAVEVDEKPELDIIDEYIEKYIYEHDEQELTDEEFALVFATSLMATRIDEYITINSKRRDFEPDKEKWYKTLATGEEQTD